jgi:lipoate-protein ligase A
MFLKARLIEYCQYSPYENMAIDEQMTAIYRTLSVPILRLYSWRPYGISIGRYQDSSKDLNLKACAGAKIPVVRRMTGGGAIFHADELTYSIVCSENDINCSDAAVKKTFETINSFIIKTYSKFGLEASYAKETMPPDSRATRSGFCFSGKEEYDVMINGKKIGGNAQRREKGLIFQHGSMPLAFSKCSEYFTCPVDEGKYTSLRELLGRPVYAQEAAANMTAAFMETFNAELILYALSTDDKREIVKLVTGKYAHPSWNL